VTFEAQLLSLRKVLRVLADDFGIPVDDLMSIDGLCTVGDMRARAPGATLKLRLHFFPLPLPCREVLAHSAPTRAEENITSRREGTSADS
jgi:hypothetical protein